MKRQRVFAAAAFLGLAVMLSTGTGFAAEDICPEADDGKHVPETIVSEDYDAEGHWQWTDCELCEKQLTAKIRVPHIFAEDGDDPEDAWMSDDEEDEDAKYLGPTCTKDGIEYRECIYPGCEYVETRVAKALGHSYERAEEDPDDIVYEYTSDTYHQPVCDDCETLGPKEKHTWDAGVVTENPTYTTEGVRTYTCTVCDGEKEEAIPRLTFAAPTGVKAQVKSNGVSLSWKKVAKADTYVVYRFSGSEKPKKIGTTKKLTYVDTKAAAATGYSYLVKAAGVKGSNVYEGDASKSVDVITTVGKVKTLKASVTSQDLMNAKVTLKWSSVSGADGYYVYQAAGKGKMKLVNDVEGDTSCVVEDVDFSASTTYRYQVRAYTRYNKEEKSGTASADVKVSKPKGLDKQVNGLSVVSTKTKQVSLKWSLYADADGYEIYRIDGTAKKAKLVGTVSQGKTTRFTDKKGLTAASGYTYTVRAYWKEDGKKKYSGYSGEACAVTSVPKVAKPSAVKSKDKKSVTLTWKKAGAATNYYVYVKAGKEKFQPALMVKDGVSYVYDTKKETYVKSGKVKVSGNNMSFQFNGINFQKYSRYQYKVMAATEYQGSLVTGNYSAAVTVKK